MNNTCTCRRCGKCWRSEELEIAREVVKRIERDMEQNERETASVMSRLSNLDKLSEQSDEVHAALIGNSVEYVDEETWQELITIVNTRDRDARELFPQIEDIIRTRTKRKDRDRVWKLIDCAFPCVRGWYFLTKKKQLDEEHNELWRRVNRADETHNRILRHLAASTSSSRRPLEPLN